MFSPRLLSGQEVGVFPLSQAAAFEKLFHAAPPGSLLEVASARKGQARGSNAKSYPHPLCAIAAERRDDFSTVVQSAIDAGDEHVFTTLAAFSRAVLAFPHREQPYSFTRDRCTHVLGIWMDLDVGRSPDDAGDASQTISSEEALRSVCQRVEEGRIPLPTMTSESGRGRHVFYVLAAAITHCPDSQRRIRAIHDELIIRLAGLAPDRSSGNMVQLFKVPGSPSVIGPVRYEMFEQGDITAPLHTLEALEDFLDVPREGSPPSEPLPERSRGRRGGINRSPQQSLAWARKRMDELRRVTPLRSHWKGFRHPLLLAYAEAARRWFRPGNSAREADRLAFEATILFNRTLPDPEDESEIRTAVFGSRVRARPQRNETVARNLAITVEETARAQLESLAHPDVVRVWEQESRQRTAEKQARERDVEERLRAGEAVASIALESGLSRSALYVRRKKLGLAR